MKMLKTLLIICVISTVRSAPVESKDLYSILVNDNRTENLRKYPFVAECKETGSVSKSLCFAMFDVALTFNDRKLDFTRNNVTFDDGSFCDSLQNYLPDTPSNNESSIAFKDLAQWLKDTLKSNNGKDECKENCFFKDRTTYKMELSPVCRFLLNQYSFLSNQSAPQISIQSASAILPKSAEMSRKS